MSTNVDVAAGPPPTRAPRVAADAHGARAAARSWLGAALLALAVGVAALSLLGPLVSGVIDYRITDLILSQLIGLDAVSLALVAPLAALAGVLTLRGHAPAAAPTIRKRVSARGPLRREHAAARSGQGG